MTSTHAHRVGVVVAGLLISLIRGVPAQAETPILLTLMNASQAVVHIESENAQLGRRMGPNARTHISSATYVRSGTGIIIDPSGIIATNAHTVIEAQHIRVLLASGKQYEASPLLMDRVNDLCLLRIHPTEALAALTLADVSKVALHSRVYSIGGSNLLRNALSEGKVTGIAFSKLLKLNPQAKKAKDIKLFQINIDLYQGDSGSPILNAAGEVIGIISAAAQRRGKTSFAIPSSLISAHLRQVQSVP